MKKILALVLSAVMLLAVMVPVAAQAAPKNVTLTVGSAEVNPDSTVSVTVELFDNPGIAGMILTPVYDTEALTLETAECENGTVFATAPTMLRNIVWAESGDSFENGTLITLVFTVKNTAALNTEYAIDLIVRECYDHAGNTVSATINAGSINVVPPLPTLTVGTVEATVGSDVYVPVELSYNTGMAGMIATLVYDKSALTLKAEACMNGTVFATAPTVGNNLVWAESDDTDANGTLITLVFSVNDAAEANTSYDVNIVVRECYDVRYNNVEVKIKAGSVSVKESASAIVKANMTLGSDLTVNYYANLDPAHAGAQMRFTRNGNVVVVDGVETATPNLYKYAYTSIAPQCMGDNIKAELIFGETVLDVKEEYSVKAYCMNTLSKSGDALGMSAEKYSALRTLVADLLTYGAKAQIYRDYKVETLVNEGVEGATEFVVLEDTDKYIYESDRAEDGIMMSAVGVYFDYTNSLYVKFLAPGLGENEFGLEVKNVVTGETMTYASSQCQLIDEETSEYLVILDPVYPTEYTDLYYIDLCVMDRNRLVSVQSLEYSFASYVYSMQNRVDAEGNLTPMAELARATYNYGLAASAYNAISQ